MIGPYQILEKLGQGGMGAVFKVSSGSAVYALKLLLQSSEEDLLRFQREARTLAQVDRHPNIVRVHSYGESPFPYIVQSFVDGQSLGDCLRRGERFNEEETLEIGLKVASALAHIHDSALLHRDLKPENILMRASDSEYLVTDFGLAKSETLESLTQTGEVLGTPSYMAPEQWDGVKEKICPATDVWALGITLYECCTGERPFQADDFVSLARKTMLEDLQDPRTLNPELSEAFVAVLFKSMEKEPERRYRDAGELLKDLEFCVTGGQVSAEIPGALTRAQRQLTRVLGPKTWLALVFGVLVLGGLVFLLESGLLIENPPQKRARAFDDKEWSRELLFSSSFVREKLKLKRAERDVDHPAWGDFQKLCGALESGDLKTFKAKIDSLPKSRSFRDLRTLALFVGALEKRDWRESLEKLAELPKSILGEKERRSLSLALQRVHTMDLLFDLKKQSKGLKSAWTQLSKEVEGLGGRSQAFWDSWNKDVRRRTEKSALGDREKLQLVARIEQLRGSGAENGKERLKLQLLLVQWLRVRSEDAAFDKYMAYLDAAAEGGLEGYDWAFIRYIRTRGSRMTDNSERSEMRRVYKSLLTLAKCGFYFEDLDRFLSLLEQRGLFQQFRSNPYNSFYRAFRYTVDDLFSEAATLDEERKVLEQKHLDQKLADLNAVIASDEVNDLIKALAHGERGDLIAVHHLRLGLTAEQGRARAERDIKLALAGPHPAPDRLLSILANHYLFRLAGPERVKLLKRSIALLEDRFKRSKTNRLAMSNPAYLFLRCEPREYARHMGRVCGDIVEWSLAPGGDAFEALKYARLAEETTRSEDASMLVIRCLKFLKRGEELKEAVLVFYKSFPKAWRRRFQDDPESLKILGASLIQERRFEAARFALKALQKLDAGAAKVLEHRLRLALEK